MTGRRCWETLGDGKEMLGDGMGDGKEMLDEEKGRKKTIAGVDSVSNGNTPQFEFEPENGRWRL